MIIQLSRSALDEQDAAPPRPDRLARLPEQHFVALRGLVEAAAGDRWRAAHRLEPRQSRGRAAAACGRRPLRRGAATDRSWVRVAPRPARAEGGAGGALPVALRRRARSGAG